MFLDAARPTPHPLFLKERSGRNGKTGIVAKIREFAIVGPSAQMPASDRQPKQLVDKLQLRECVTFTHPSGSPLPNHVDRLDSHRELSRAGQQSHQGDKVPGGLYKLASGSRDGVTGGH